MTPTLLLYSAAAVFSLVALYLLLRPRLRDLRTYIRQTCTCGHLPAPPTARALACLRRWAWLLLKVQVGKIHVVGRENLVTPGPKVIAPNHGHSVDPAPFALLLEEPARYMAASGVFKFFGGLGALLAGPAGAFAADLDKGKGGPAREAAVRVLTSGQTLVMFPEGWAWMTGRVGEFKKGAVRIALEAAQKLGRTTYIVPVYMRYGKHPGDWILRFPPPVQYLLVMLLFPIYRRGLTIVVGKPIASSELPEDAGEATAMLKARVLALDPDSSKPLAMPAAQRLL